ncbi:porin [Paracoccus zhejiangensis]|uniref:Porin n=1 Tax=Paracoccus zhejiangensis TaxID=1077935 RepID=A0A2H5F101_9RHOB|nr:porin [Paracoccus zhejiangensis]AUH65207.1 porin [Paracoccus zhejiangensis]
MKKVLFATTALVMTAGVASAEIALSGDARMGLVYDGNDAQFASRARVRFTATGETDSGLSYGASFRVDHERAAQRAGNGTRGAVYVSGTYGKLSMGDVASASEMAVGDLYGVGYTGGDFYGNLNEPSYLTADGNNLDQGPNILYEYSISGVNVFASATDGSDDPWGPAYGEGDNSTDSDLAWSLGASYEGTFSNGTYNVGLGYGKHGDQKEIVVGGEVTSGAFMAKAFYADYKNRPDINFAISDDESITIDNTGIEYDRAYGLSLGYEYNNMLFKGFWRRDEGEAVVAGLSDVEYDSWGIGVDYDLGGGATVAAGIADSDWFSDTVADVGIRFAF